MKWIRIIKRLLAGIIGVKTTNSNVNIDIANQNYILALSPVDINSNIAGYIIIVMLIAILVLIGYTFISNSKK